MQRYLVLINVYVGKGEEFWAGFSKLPNQPRKGVKPEASHSLSGKWDFALVFKPDRNDNALHFVGEDLRSIAGITKTFNSLDYAQGVYNS